MNVPGRETFAEHARRRTERRSLQEGHDAMNDRIRDFADSKRSSPSVREMQQFEQREREFEQREQALREPKPPTTDANAARTAGLDQGARGGAQHRPKPTNPNDALRADFREKRGL